jgi:hypothetical protein
MPRLDERAARAACTSRSPGPRMRSTKRAPWRATLALDTGHLDSVGADAEDHGCRLWWILARVDHIAPIQRAAIWARRICAW